MATETLSSIVEDSTRAAMEIALPRLVEAVAKHLKSGKSVDEVVEAIAEQKLPSSRSSKGRSNSETRKPSGRSSSRAPTSRTLASKGKKSEKAPKWISSAEYREDYADRDVCTFIPSRGDNSTKICCAEVEDPSTSDTSRVRCSLHKKSDLDASAQRFSKTMSSSLRRSTDDLEVSDNHRAPLSTSSARGTASTRSARGVPTALSSRSRTNVGSRTDSRTAAQKSDSNADESDAEPTKPGLTSSRTPVRGSTGVASRIGRLSTRQSDDQKTSDTRNPLSSRMTRTPEPEASDHDDDETQLSRRSVASSSARTTPKEESKTRERESAESPKRSLPTSRTRVTRETTPPRETDSTPLETEPVKRSVRATRVTRREPTPDLEPDAEPQDVDADQDQREPTPEKPRRSSRREPTPESRESTPPDDEPSTDLESYTVPNAANVEWIKLGDSKFLGVDGTKALGIYPSEIKDGVKLPPVWKSKLVKKDFDAATLSLIKKLGLELP